MEEEPKFPFRLVFVPKVSTPSHTPVLGSGPAAKDFTENIVNSLTKVGQHLFDVMAYDQPQNLQK